MSTRVLKRLVVGSLSLCAAIGLAACAATDVARVHGNATSTGGHETTASHRCMSSTLAERLAHPDPTLPVLPADYSAPDAPRPVFACYDPEFPPSQEVIQRIEEQLYAFSLQYQLGSRWTTTASGTTGAAGTPITITWSFVPDGLSIGSGVGEPVAPSNLFAQMDSKFSGNRALWIQRFTDSFTRWGQLSGINYVRVTFGGNDWDDGATWGSAGMLTRRGDVRISGKAIDGAAGILAYDGMPNQSDMVVDMAENWGSSTNNHRFLRNVIMHEHGHGLGFAHVCPGNSTKLMEPLLATNFDGPQQDEIRAVQRFYGDPNENDNSAATATDIGTRNPSTALTVGTTPTLIDSAPNDFSIAVPTGSSVLSIDGDGEQDWFRFTLNQPLLVSVTLTPVGTTYLNGPQNANGSCSAGTNFNATAQANLRLQIFGPDGATPIATVDANAAGLAETASTILCPAGNSFVRVTETAAMTESQLYRFSITTGSLLTISASDAAFADKVTLTWTNIPNALTYRVFRNTTNDRLTATLVGSPVTNAFDDLTAVAGTDYFYWVQASQAAGVFFDMAGPDAGSVSAPPACPADFNQDGSVDPDDLGDFINCFFGVPPCPQADFNADGSVDPDDLGDFINTFFGPAC